MVWNCVLNKIELSLHYKKYDRNGLKMFYSKKLKVFTLEK